MKRLIFAAVLLLSFTMANAQFNFGLKAGYNSSLSFSNIGNVADGTYNFDDVKAEMWNSFHAGLFTRIYFNKLYVEPELLYSVQKTDYQITIQDAALGQIDVQKFVNISTVDVPLLVGYQLLDLKIANLRAFAGPKLRFNAGSSLDFQNVTGGNFDLSNLQRDIKDAALGFEIGAGIDVLMFALDARYNLIGNMYETNINQISLENLPSSTFVVSLAWKIF